MAPDGGGVCVGGWTFRTDDPSAYTRVDRMGMPAVSTALVSDTSGPATTKNDYNDGDPSDDAAGTFAPELVANLTALHGAIDDDLAGATLVPCLMTPMPNCLTQEVAPGVRQKVWTFGGTAPGPTLRGKVGDTFEVTLTNGAGMGHGVHHGRVRHEADEPAPLSCRPAREPRALPSAGEDDAAAMRDAPDEELAARLEEVRRAAAAMAPAGGPE